jgi:hypothetical protein
MKWGGVYIRPCPWDNRFKLSWHCNRTYILWYCWKKSTAHDSKYVRRPGPHSNGINAAVLTSFHVARRDNSKCDVQLHIWEAHAATFFFETSCHCSNTYILWWQTNVTSRYVHETTIPQPCCQFNCTYGLGCWESAAPVTGGFCVRITLPFRFILIFCYLVVAAVLTGFHVMARAAVCKNTAAVLIHPVIVTILTF